MNTRHGNRRHDDGCFLLLVMYVSLLHLYKQVIIDQLVLSFRLYIEVIDSLAL